MVAETRYEGIFIPSLSKLLNLDLKTVHLYVKRSILLGVLVKDRTYGLGWFITHIMTTRKKNKIILKGIKIYHSFYKPKHAASPRSAIEKAYLDAVSSFFSEFPGSEASVSSILNWKRIPLSSSYSFQRSIGSYSPENGVGIRVVDGEAKVTFDSHL